MQRIIVSLTTTASRHNICAQAVFSILNQSKQPDIIRIWISKSPYLRDIGMTQEPEWVANLNKIKNIIEIHWTENTGPYRKLIPSLKIAEDDDIIVTADDDIVYGKRWLKLLIETAQNNPECLVAARVRHETKNILGIKKSYISWPLINKTQMMSAQFAVTYGGGAVFRKSFIAPYLINDNAYSSICPTADDLWYNRLVRESNLKVLVCSKALEELYFIAHEDGLDNHNLLKSKAIMRKIYNKIFLRILGWSGFNVCGNDHSYKKIEKYNFDATVRK